VIAVTNLDDAGPGSFRAAVEAPGPRIVVFHIGGTITIETPLRIENPFITIAGQTAPGGGVTLRSGGQTTRPLLEILTNDVVIRYLRIRRGPDTSARGSCCADALSVLGASAFNVIIDHVSLSWAVDENAQIFDGARDVTFQWSIFSEGLFCSNHQKTVSSAGGNGACPNGASPHSRGMTISTFPGGVSPDRISLHHNLWTNSQTRYPNVTSNTSIDVVNNVMYNFTTQGSGLGLKNPGNLLRANFVNNFYKPGPSTIAGGSTWAIVLTVPSFQADAFEIYYEGNEVSAPIEPAWVGWDGAESRHRVAEPLVAPAITTTSAQVAFTQVLAGAGSTVPARDAVDTRVVDEVRLGTGGFVDHPNDVGGWPALAAGSPPADADLDGMPDQWESDNGLDPGDGADGPADADGDGYTNVEEFLNGTDPNVRT